MTPTLGALASCAGQLPGTSDDGGREVTPRSTVMSEPDSSVSLTAGSGTVRPAPETSTTNWMYGDQFPGPELRKIRGESLAVHGVNESEALVRTPERFAFWGRR